MNEDMPWVNLTQEEVEELRNKKHELTEYGKQKLRKLMTEPLHAKVSDEDYQKIVDYGKEERFGQLAYVDEWDQEQEQKRQRVLERYNHYYNMECASLPHGTPITPEHQQIIAFESMIDALRCENLNHEFDVILTSDIEDLIERLRNQANEYLKKVKEFKDSADGVA